MEINEYSNKTSKPLCNTFIMEGETICGKIKQIEEQIKGNECYAAVLREVFQILISDSQVVNLLLICGKEHLQLFNILKAFAEFINPQNNLIWLTGSRNAVSVAANNSFKAVIMQAEECNKDTFVFWDLIGKVRNNENIILYTEKKESIFEPVETVFQGGKVYGGKNSAVYRITADEELKEKALNYSSDVALIRTGETILSLSLEVLSQMNQVKNKEVMQLSAETMLSVVKKLHIIEEYILKVYDNLENTDLKFMANALKTCAMDYYTELTENNSNDIYLHRMIESAEKFEEAVEKEFENQYKKKGRR